MGRVYLERENEKNMRTNFEKQIEESHPDKFSKCNLAKGLDDRAFSYSVCEYDKPFIREYEKNCPIENGNWEKERGDSKWIPDLDYIPQKSNPEEKTWEEILDKYDIEGIQFNEGEPDFNEIDRGKVEIVDFSERREDNFAKADIEMAKKKDCLPQEVVAWRKENGYTWHECKDMKTMQKVPRSVHNNIPHSGGIAEIKKGNIDI